MIWQFPTLMALQQSTDALQKSVIKQRVIDSSLEGTVPDHVIERSIETSNPFSKDYWFPEQASDFAPAVDSLFMDIFWISLVFFVAIVAVMVYFCVVYRRKNGVIDPQPSPSHNTNIEILWSVLPSLFLVYMFYVGAGTFWEMKVPKADSEEIQVIAFKYGWQFIYPNGDKTNELHLVQDQPVVLKMQSKTSFTASLSLHFGKNKTSFLVATPLLTSNLIKLVSTDCLATSTAVTDIARCARHALFMIHQKIVRKTPNGSRMIIPLGRMANTCTKSTVQVATTSMATLAQVPR